MAGPRARALVATLGAGLLGMALAGCGVPVAGTGAQAAVPPGTHVFGAQRPRWADCSRVNLDALSQLSAVTVPAGTAEVAPLDVGRPAPSWAQCVGRSDTSVVWLVGFATSVDATNDTQRQSDVEQGPDLHALVRPARLGDARAEVIMNVHADDHTTLVLVTVFDPQTGRAAAHCGLAAARGDLADRAADWCLKAVADQLARPWLTAAPSTPAASATSGVPISPTAGAAPAASGSAAGTGRVTATAAPTDALPSDATGTDGAVAPSEAADPPTEPTVTVTVTRAPAR